MISPDDIEFFESIMINLTPKQKSVAENLMFDKTYHILKVYDNKIPKFILKNRFTGDIIDLITYVKSKCNC